jgi:hypothetical protein
MTAVLDEQRRAAAGDAEKLKKIDAKIAQREGHPFGFLCARDGEFNVECKEYPGLRFEHVRIQPHVA